MNTFPSHLLLVLMVQSKSYTIWLCKCNPTSWKCYLCSFTNSNNISVSTTRFPILIKSFENGNIPHRVISKCQFFRTIPRSNFNTASLEKFHQALAPEAKTGPFYSAIFPFSCCFSEPYSSIIFIPVIISPLGALGQYEMGRLAFTAEGNLQYSASTAQFSIDVLN